MSKFYVTTKLDVAAYSAEARVLLARFGKKEFKNHYTCTVVTSAPATVLSQMVMTRFVLMGVRSKKPFFNFHLITK